MTGERWMRRLGDTSQGEVIGGAFPTSIGEVAWGYPSLEAETETPGPEVIAKGFRFALPWELWAEARMIDGVMEWGARLGFVNLGNTPGPGMARQESRLVCVSVDVFPVNYGQDGFAMDRFGVAPVLRRLPIEEITRELSLAAARMRVPSDEGGVQETPLPDEKRGLASLALQRVQRDALRDLDPEHLLKRVAKVYCAARDQPARRGTRPAPTMAVADDLGVSRATAARRISEARKVYPEMFDATAQG